MSPAVKAMTRLGVVKVTLISTVASSLASSFVAWIFSFFIVMKQPGLHMWLAFVIPYFVAPGFSYFTALAMPESKRARIRAMKAARLDPLTELPNRRAFFEDDGRAEGAFGLQARRTVLFIDIDHFKAINDHHSHEGGDEVLRQFARSLTQCLREGDLVARFGGEEFVVELTGAGLDEAESVAERIRLAAQSTPVVFRSSEIAYSVSIGVAAGTFAESIDRLMSVADSQLYLAKQSGRNRIRMQTVAPGAHAHAAAAAPEPLAVARQVA